ncbi:MAG: hypothetical protein PHF56_12405 [Desulfuromonadaceae bacterium]|nr:hypothetical protein [Desulfuromonadaceae bacterium]
MNTSIPNDLAFDDEPLDGILYGADCPEATPADILERWQGKYAMPPESRDAILAILAKEPEKGLSLEKWQLESIVAYMERSLTAGEVEHPRELMKLASICHATGRFEQAEIAYRQILEYRNSTDPLLDEERWQAMKNLFGLLNQLGRTKEAQEERMVYEGEMLLADKKCNDLEMVRSLARELFVSERHADAERLYRGLLAQKFQLPGTLIHLARILLIQDRLPEARKAIADAWKLLRNQDVWDVPFYVLHRVIFFRILCAMLTRGDYSRQVARLKRALLKNSLRELWTIEPVIMHFKTYLRPSDLDFLVALAEAINSAENMDRLNVFPAWVSQDSGLNDGQ